MYSINQQYNSAADGKVDLNIKSKTKWVGEWYVGVKRIPLYEAPNEMMCFSLSDWLTVIKPKLKEGSRYYHSRSK